MGKLRLAAAVATRMVRPRPPLTTYLVTLVQNEKGLFEEFFKARGMKRIILLFTIIILLPVDSVLAYGAPDFLPDKSHPRIILNQEKITELNLHQKKNTQEWIEFINWCDTHLGDGGFDTPGAINWNGYRGSGYLDYLISYSLAYQVLKDDNPTKAEAYADYALAILRSLPTTYAVGEEANGLAAIRAGEAAGRTINAKEAVLLGIKYATYKNGYTARTFGVAVPIAYDWLYEKLTDADKKAIMAMMFRWVDWYRGVRSKYNNGVLINGIRYYEDVDGVCDDSNVCTTNTRGTAGYGVGAITNNYFSGYYEMAVLTALATYGDTPDAQIYYALARSLTNDFVKKELLSDTGHSGGDSTEGWNYGSGWWRVLEAMYAIETATGEDVFTGFPWPQDLLRAYIHSHNSYLTIQPIYGEWTGNWVGVPYQHIFLTLFGINYAIDPSQPLLELAQYFNENAGYKIFAREWLKLLWQPSIPVVSRPLTQGEPLYFHSVGDGRVTMRSSWEARPDSIMAYIRLEGRLTNSHEGYDEGDIQIIRGNDRLLTYGETRASVGYNTVVFNNLSHHADNPPLTSPAIDRLEHSQDYLYVRGDITNAYKRKYKVNLAKLFVRNLLYIRPNFFVLFDVTQSNPDVGNLKSWYTQHASQPTVDTAAKIISSVSGSSKIFVKTLYPENGRFNVSNPSPGLWRVKFEPEPQNANEVFLHVLIPDAAETLTMPQTSLIKSAEGNMIGAAIDGGVVYYICLFSSSISNTDVTGSVTFQIPTDKDLDIFLAGMPPRQAYNISLTAVTSSSSILRFSLTPDPNGIVAASANGLLRIKDNDLQGIPVQPSRTYIKLIETR